MLLLFCLGHSDWHVEPTEQKVLKEAYVVATSAHFVIDTFLLTIFNFMTKLEQQRR